MKAIELLGATFGYDGVTAIHGLHLEVGAGELVALVGPNGAGKTSTISAVCGRSRLGEGSARLGGREVTRASPRERARLGLATVPDDRGIFTQLTVGDNLRLGGRRRLPPLALDDWFPGLLPLLDRPAGLLSGGEQTILALARAVSSHPRALVVDELTTGLAPPSLEAAARALRRAASEWGTGVLLADQAADLAVGIVDRVVVLRRGEVVFDGAPAGLRDRPGLLEATYLGDVD